MKAIILMTVVALLSTPVLKAQIDNAKTETVKVYGNCGMCEAAIEKAAKKKKVSKADWNEQTKIATITYDSKKTDLDAVLKNIALAGYDNQNYLAPDNAYAKLPDCCKYERQSKHTVKTTTQGPDLITPKQDHTGHTQGKNTENTNQTSQLKSVFDNYFGLKDALVKTDGATASIKASALLTALNEIEMGKLKTEEHDVWMKVEKTLKSDAQHIKENKDTEHQREHFMTLSKNMYELVKASKPAETVYYQFCPMANDGKGANWLSKENTIKNPYYGSQMLSCGKTVETIKQ
jgi:copper chaperone CopZ